MSEPEYVTVDVERVADRLYREWALSQMWIGMDGVRDVLRDLDTGALTPAPHQMEGADKEPETVEDERAENRKLTDLLTAALSTVDGMNATQEKQEGRLDALEKDALEAFKRLAGLDRAADDADADDLEAEARLINVEIEALFSRRTKIRNTQDERRGHK